MRSPALDLFLVALILLVGSSAVRADDSTEANALKILKKHCYQCHGVKLEIPGFNVLDRDVLTATRIDATPYVTPGNAAESALWQRMGVQGDMPPEKITERPTKAELETIKAWIEAGAHFPTNTTREFISEKDILTKIHDHLSKQERDSRPFQRYFSLAHLHNNDTVKDDDLRLYRAAFVKLVNSLSLNPQIIHPEMIDASAENPHGGLIFNLDLRDTRWDEQDWRKLLSEYPYGLDWNDPELSNQVKDIESETGKLAFDGVAYIRVDWFINHASRPPAYHRFLKLPETIGELEKSLGVDVQRDFLQERMQRAGFAGSSVSRHNRLVDRHVGRNTRYYYRSYDFGKSFARSVLFRFPLGPEFEANKFNDFAFQADGGEVIWQLPNGLQGYLIVTGAGERLDEAPISVVRDVNEHSGTPVVVNGVSCIGCHKDGLHNFEDAIRDSFALTGDARRKVTNLYAEVDTTKRLLAEDRASFVQALEKTIGPILRQGSDADKELAEFPEPVSRVVSWYNKDLGPYEVAAELGLETPDKLPIQGNLALQELGLGPLASGYKIPRGMWDSRDAGPSSIYQKTAVAIGLGAAVTPN